MAPTDANTMMQYFFVGVTGSSSVSFDAGAIDSSSLSSSRRRTTAYTRFEKRRCLSGGCTQSTTRGPKPSRRKLNELTSTSASTIVVASLLFSANGKPSEFADGGVTQIRVTSTSSGEVSSYFSEYDDIYVRYCRHVT